MLKNIVWKTDLRIVYFILQEVILRICNLEAGHPSLQRSWSIYVNYLNSMYNTA